MGFIDRISVSQMHNMKQYQGLHIKREAPVSLFIMQNQLIKRIKPYESDKDVCKWCSDFLKMDFDLVVCRIYKKNSADFYADCIRIYEESGIRSCLSFIRYGRTQPVIQ